MIDPAPSANTLLGKCCFDYCGDEICDCGRSEPFLDFMPFGEGPGAVRLTDEERAEAILNSFTP